MFVFLQTTSLRSNLYIIEFIHSKYNPVSFTWYIEFYNAHNFRPFPTVQERNLPTLGSPSLSVLSSYLSPRCHTPAPGNMLAVIGNNMSSPGVIPFSKISKAQKNKQKILHKFSICGHYKIWSHRNRVERRLPEVVPDKYATTELYPFLYIPFM